MGTDKALLPWNGSTLLARAVSCAREALDRAGATEAPVWVSGAYEGFASVPDLEPGLGPLGGLHAVTVRAHRERIAGRVVVLPVDMPLLRAEALEALCAAPRCSHFEGFELPAIFELSELSACLGELISAPPRERSIRRLLSELSAVSISPPADWALQSSNANTPDEFRRLL